MVGIKNFEMPHNCYDCELHNYHECDLTSEPIEDDYCWNGDSREKHCPLVEAIPKDQYENRLNADMVAMLTDLSMKIGEIEDGYTEFDEENKRSLTMIPLESVERLIDREINSLKGEGEK